MNETSDLKTYLRLLTYLAKWRVAFVGSIIGFIIFAATQTALAHLMKYFVDSLQSDSEKYLMLVPVALIIIAFIRGIGFFMGNYLLAKVSMNIVHDIRCELFSHLMMAPKKFYDQSNVGEILSLILFNVSQVSSAATNAIKILIREGFTIIGLIIYLFWMNWKVTGLFILVAPVIGVLVYFIGKRLKDITKRMQSSMGGITHVAKESLSSVQVVRAYGAQDYENRRFETSSKEATKLSLKMVRTTAAGSPLIQFIVAVALAGLMYAMLRFFEDQSAGDVIAYITAAGLIPKPMRQLADIWGMLQRGIVASESVFQTLDSEREKDTGTYESDRVDGKIEITDMSFGYQGEQEKVFDHLNLTVNAGQMIALVGHSGSGKTTLTNLLLRFYDYDSGSIKVDGVELKDYRLKNLRKQFALVTQNIELFNDSVRNNVAYGVVQDYSDEQIWEALEKANASEFVRSLDGGLDAFIGENGSKLSGGQKQRIVIARALLVDSPILILDEATSALDAKSEKLIQQALEVVSKDRTTIVIAHRLSTIVKADRILVFDKGKIIEQGSHKELLDKGEYYASLYKTQFS